MAYITSDIDELLKEHNLELTLFEKMEPELNMLGMFEKKDNNGKDTFAFARDETTAEKMILDGIMKEPVELLEGAELPEVQITGINKNVGKMRRIGFQAVFTEEAIKDNINYDKIKKLNFDVFILYMPFFRIADASAHQYPMCLDPRVLSNLYSVQRWCTRLRPATFRFHHLSILFVSKRYCPKI